MVVLGALSGGLLLGVAGALVRDRVDRKIRRVVDAEASVGRPVIAVLPDISQAAGREQPVIEPVSVGSTQGRVLPTDLGLLRYSVTRPFSHTAEAFRRIKISLTLNEANGKAIGVTSTAPNEGKTFVSSNFAQDLARAGRRVLLIDGDLRNPTLSKTFCPDEKLGLQDILAGRAAWRDAIHTDPVTGLAFLPSRPASANENFADLFSSKAFASLMENMSAHFDKIVIDLAPIASTIDARAISQNVDGFLFVLGWGNLPRDVLERALSEAPEVHAKIKGVVLNRVDEKRIKLFDAYNASLYGYGYQYNRA